MKILLWNVEWAKPNSSRGKKIVEIIQYYSPDICCLTEAYLDFFLNQGYTVSSNENYGYKITKGKRKVLLWSKEEWQDTNCGEDLRILPPGRFVNSTTQYKNTDYNILGVCIPWKDAHVSTGQKNKKRWEDHQNYINGLKEYFVSNDIKSNRIILGDFNQTIPRTIAPKEISEALETTFKEYKIITNKITDEDGKLLIDHVAVNFVANIERIKIIPKTDVKGLRLSDHSGVLIEINAKK